MNTKELSTEGVNTVTFQTRQDLIEQLSEYVEHNQEKLYRLAYSYCKNQDNAMDILQEAITKAISKIFFLREEKYLKTWFYRILINTAIDATKKNKIDDVFPIEEYEIQSIDSDITCSIDLYQEIDRLKPKLKTVIILRFYEDMKLEEIATITNTNTNTVKSRLYKALKQLKIQIRGEF